MGDLTASPRWVSVDIAAGAAGAAAAAGAASGVIAGFGAHGYELAIEAAAGLLAKSDRPA